MKTKKTDQEQNIINQAIETANQLKITVYLITDNGNLGQGQVTDFYTGLPESLPAHLEVTEIKPAFQAYISKRNRWVNREKVYFFEVSICARYDLWSEVKFDLLENAKNYFTKYLSSKPKAIPFESAWQLK